jgi:hypothetical protein
MTPLEPSHRHERDVLLEVRVHQHHSRAHVAEQQRREPTAHESADAAPRHVCPDLTRERKQVERNPRLSHADSANYHSPRGHEGTEAKQGGQGTWYTMTAAATTFHMAVRLFWRVPSTSLSGRQKCVDSQDAGQKSKAMHL